MSPVSSYEAWETSLESSTVGSWLVAGLVAIFACYLFVGLKVLADDYLSPSLDELSDLLDIPASVSAATFVAFGSSAPELVISAIGSATNATETTIPTVLASALIAFGAIPALVLVAARTPHTGPEDADDADDDRGRTSSAGPSSSSSSSSEERATLTLDPVSQFRDAIAYALALLALFAYSFDSHTDLLQSLGLLALYGVYVVVVFFVHQADDDDDDDGGGPHALGTAPAMIVAAEETKVAPPPSYDEKRPWAGVEEGKPVAAAPPVVVLETPLGRPPAVPKDDGDQSLHGGPDDERSPLLLQTSSRRRSFWERLEEALEAPYRACCALTIVGGPAQRFAITITWIAALSYVAVAAAGAITTLTCISEATSGMTLLAVGAQVPDCIAAVELARNGQADSALAQAVGSQVINITFGLGLPFAVTCLAYGRDVVTTNNYVVRNLSVCLFAMVLAYLGVMAAGLRRRGTPASGATKTHVVTTLRRWPSTVVFLSIFVAVYALAITSAELDGPKWGVSS